MKKISRRTFLIAAGLTGAAAALSGCGTIEAAAEEVKKSSRHYAKRQLTWFRRNKAMHWLTRSPGEDTEEIIRRARQLLIESDN